MLRRLFKIRLPRSGPNISTSKTQSYAILGVIVRRAWHLYDGLNAGCLVDMLTKSYEYEQRMVDVGCKLEYLS
jgi:hypothetical protein